MSVCQLQVGRRVQALWASAWFEARVLATGRCEDEDEDQGKPCCLIHYILWVAEGMGRVDRASLAAPAEADRCGAGGGVDGRADVRA